MGFRLGTPVPVSSSAICWMRPQVPAALESVASHSATISSGEAAGDDPAAQRQHVGVVVLPRHARGIEIVAERGARPRHLVGGHLLPLAAAADHDAAVGAVADDGPRHVGADLG